MNLMKLLTFKSSMGIKKIFLVFFLILFYFNYTDLSAKIPTDAIKPYCNGNFEKNNSSNLIIDELKVIIYKNKQWNENLLKIHLNYEKKKNQRIHKNWISNFRITDVYKKKYKAKVSLKYKNHKPCNFEAKVRLTGDLWWHLDWKNGSPISSLHVQLLNGHVKNITKFKLFLKKSRQGNNEVFVANFFKQLGFLSPKTFLIDTKINNVPVEYIFQEDIKKELIENSSYREGPIIEGDERFTVKLNENEKINFKAVNYAKISNQKYLQKNKINTIIGAEALSNLNKIYLYNHKFKFTKKINDPFENIFYIFTNKFFKKKNIEILNSFEALSYALDVVHGLSMDDRRYYYDAYNKFYLPIYYDGKSKILNKNQFTTISKGTKIPNLSNEAIHGASKSLQLVNNISKKKFLETLNKSGLSMNNSDLDQIIKKIITRLEIIKNSKLKDKTFKLDENFYDLLKKNKNSIKFIYSDNENQNFLICNLSSNECKQSNFDEKSYLTILNEGLNQNFNTIEKKESTKIKYVYVSDINLSKINKFNFFNKDWKTIELLDTKIEFIDSKISINEIDKTIYVYQENIDGKALFIGGELKNWNIFFEGIQNTTDKKNNFLKNPINLTGCITFYETKLNNINIYSNNSNCEDSVNIIRSKGLINKIKINNSISDSLDIDFSNIEIKNMLIMNSQNDCADFSFGNYILDEIDLSNCGDKGISVGEKSSMLINNIKVDNTSIGIASKDSSITKIKNASFLNTELCLSAYRKKIEFSKGKFILQNINCNNVKN